MSGLDDFIRDGVFETHCHTLIFDNGETAPVLEEQLREIDRICKADGIAYVVREIRDESGNPAYQFGFADAESYGAFVTRFCNTFDPGAHVQTVVLYGRPSQFKEDFLNASRDFLTRLRIRHDVRYTAMGDLEFAFDRIADRVTFAAKADSLLNGLYI